jgi:prepilin-type N-terminal cleavage/methylation domain-containing protein
VFVRMLNVHSGASIRRRDWLLMIMKNMSKDRVSKERGFTLIELVVVVAVMLVVAGMAVPNFMSAVHSAHLKGAVSDFAGLLQAERIRAVDDDLFYSAYVLAGNPEEGFVDIAGKGATTIDPKDPVIQVNSEISQQPVGAAPKTASLRALFLPANATVQLGDGSVANSAITFGSRGLPCSAPAGVCKTRLPGGDVAYWIFFQNNVTQNWGAVTVTPAGRIRRWIFTGGAAGNWVSY